MEVSTGGNKSKNIGFIGAAVGSSVLVLLLLCIGAYAFHQERKAKRVLEQSKPFASWEPTESSASIPNLRGAGSFSFEELKKCTNNFSEDNGTGSGGYGQAYRGTPATGQLVAIKRVQQGSLQDALEFKTEIELLSRIHHKNVVRLVGFCYKQGEQMLVYEYSPNGTLKLIQGCMDSEYDMIQQLMEKSDVFSFGVVLLELVTGRMPIERGKHIVTLIKEAKNKSKDSLNNNNLQHILDSAIGGGTSLVCMEKFVELAMSCVHESANGMPSTGEVVREIENIIELATGLNLNS